MGDPGPRQTAGRDGLGGRGDDEKARRSKRSRFRVPSLDLVSLRKLLPEIRLLLAKLWRQIRPTVHGDLTYGFLDPALTGISQAMIAVLPIGEQLRLTPDFTEGRLTGWITMRATIHPIKIAGVVIVTALRPAVRSWWWPRLKSSVKRSLTLKSTKEVVSQ